MSGAQHRVATVAELLAAVSEPGAVSVVVSADLSDIPTFRLSPGQTLRAANDAPISLRFAADQDGVQLSSDNQLERLTLEVQADRRAVFNDLTVQNLGRLMLKDLRTIGVVQLLAAGAVRGGHVEVENVDIVAADARGYSERPRGFGVQVIPGAFVLWNQQPDPSITITAELAGLSAGRAGAPVLGSGIFVSGAGEMGGRLVVSQLVTGAVYTDGRIAAGVPDRITGGVFVVSGAFVNHVHNRGPVTTYGPNDMVLDNWGTVGRWTAEEKITSFGPSGIGFVNFGALDQLEVNDVIETFGLGARGFNVYTGTVNTAQFERIVTHADGAVGIQISQPVGEITVRRGIETFGGTGDSLVKGVVVQLPAIALSIKQGGSVRRTAVAGGVVTHGPGISPLEIQGRVDSLEIAGGITATGGGFQKL